MRGLFGSLFVCEGVCVLVWYCVSVVCVNVLVCNCVIVLVC